MSSVTKDSWTDSRSEIFNNYLWVVAHLAVVVQWVLHMAGQGVDQHTSCGYALDVVGMLHTVVVDMHVVPLLDIAALVVHVVDMVAEFPNML